MNSHHAYYKSTRNYLGRRSSKYGFKNQLVDIVTNHANPIIRTKLIARLLKGKLTGDLLELADNITITPNLSEVISELRKQGYITGIISESYDCITNHLKNKFSFDFTISNELEFSKSFATGEVKIPSIFVSGDNSQCKHDYCKLNVLTAIYSRYKVDLKNTLMIGDGENDICCLKKAGIGVSFCSTSNLVDSVADYVIKEPDFQLLIPILA